MGNQRKDVSKSSKKNVTIGAFSFHCKPYKLNFFARFIQENFFLKFLGETFHFLKESCKHLARFNLVCKTLTRNDCVCKKLTRNVDFARILQDLIWSARLLQEMIVSARNLQEMLILQESCKILARFVFPVDQGNDDKKILTTMSLMTLEHKIWSVEPITVTAKSNPKQNIF